MPDQFDPHIQNIIGNIGEVDQLTQIHQQVGGSAQGQRHKLEILNRSAIVLLVACWEAYIEDLAELAFTFVLKELKDPSHLPAKVRALVAAALIETQDPKKTWDLAGNGWKTVLKKHKSAVLERYVGRLNSPRPKQVDGLFESLIGLRTMSKCWKWQGTSNRRVLERLEDLVTLRGAIAHRVNAGTSVRRLHVDNARDLVGHLSASSSNRVSEHLEQITGTPAFQFVTYGKGTSQTGL